MKGKFILQLSLGIFLFISGFGMVYDSTFNEIYTNVLFEKGIVLGQGAVLILWGIREFIGGIYGE